MRLTIKRFKLDLDTHLFWHCYHDKIKFIQCKMYTEFDDDCPYWYVWFELSFITIKFWWTNYEPEPMTCPPVSNDPVVRLNATSDIEFRNH